MASRVFSLPPLSSRDPTQSLGRNAVKPKLRRCNWPQAMHFALLNGMELFCFRRPISLFDGGPKTKHPPPSTAATMTTTTFPRSSTPTTSHLSLFFKKNSRHHHRPCLPRRRHPLRPAQRRGHRRAMRFDGENFVYPSRKTKFREEFCFPSKFFKEKSQAHFLTPEKKKCCTSGAPSTSTAPRWPTSPRPWPARGSSARSCSTRAAG